MGIDFMSKTVKVKNSGEVKLQMWDTAGQERFRSLIPGYLKDSMAALIIFDLSSKIQFVMQILGPSTILLVGLIL